MPRFPNLAPDSGRQDAQTPRRPGLADTVKGSDETCPSRIHRGRVSLRLSSEKLLFYKQWCRNQPLVNGKEMTLQDAMELAMDQLTRRPDAQTPSSSVCVLDPDPDLKTPERDHSQLNPQTHTHRKRAGRQDVQPALPIMRRPMPVQQMQRSAYSLEVNLDYAWDAHRNDRGIRNPDAWAAANFRSGKYDPMVKIWLDGNQREQLGEHKTCRRCGARFRPPDELTIFCCPTPM